LAFGPVKARQYIQEAFNDWAKHTGLTFRQAIGYEKADFNLAFVYGHHGDGFPLGGSSTILAHAFHPWDTQNRGNIHFDSSKPWSDT
jgi:hypothetical protein